MKRGFIELWVVAGIGIALAFMAGSYYKPDVLGSGGRVLTTSAGITSLGGLTGGTQTFANDTNVTISSSGTTHTLGWTSVLSVLRGGTGQSSFGQGWLHTDGTTFTASTSPTVNYITATSTTATSTFAFDLRVDRNIILNGGNYIYGDTTRPHLQLSDSSGAEIGYQNGTHTHTIWTGSAIQQIINDVEVSRWTGTGLGIGSTTPQRALVTTSAVTSECNLTDGATVTFNLATCNQGKVVLGGNRTLDFTNETQALGQGIRFIACQDGTGSRTITWDSAIRWAGGTAPTLTTTANKCDVIAGFTTAATGTPVILLDKSLNF